MERVLDGVYSGLRYAFTVAASAELFDMARQATIHLQPLTDLQSGVVLGTAIGASAYALANRNTVWIQGGTFPGTDELTRQTEGKVVHFRSGGPKSYPL